VAETRDVYVEKVKGQLDRWNAELDAMEARVGRGRAEARARAGEQLDALRKRYQEARARLDGVRHATKDAWQDLKGGLDEAQEALREGLDDARSRLA